MTARLGRILMIRLDRIGDLVLTLPVDESLEADTIEWWIPPGLEFVTELALPRRLTRAIQKQISFVSFMTLLREVRARRFDAAIVFHAPWWVSLLLWLARVPIRAGVRSQWHSFLFFNRSVRQKRSRAEHSELEYNFRLVEAVLGRSTGTFTRRPLILRSETEREFLLKRHGLKAGAYSVVHPGMGGSALNWPTSKYDELIRGLLQRGETVVITGTAADSAFLAPLRNSLGLLADVVWLDGKLSGRELVTVLAAARSTFAPSTGVLHLAASTGKPTVGIFSPVRVQHPMRWGPQGEKVKALLPTDIACPGELRCLGPSCPHHDCMNLIRPADVLTARDRLESGPQ